MDIQDTIKWVMNSLNPDIEQRILSSKRLEICNICPHKIEWEHENMLQWRCEVCGCGNMIAKSHLKSKGVCPLDKWRDVENEML